MPEQTKFSAKGQVVIPKHIRDRHRFVRGHVVDVIETPEGILLRTPGSCKAASVEDALARVHAVFDYEGPRLDEADWQAGIARAITRKWAKAPR